VSGVSSRIRELLHQNFSQLAASIEAGNKLSAADRELLTSIGQQAVEAAWKPSRL